jgi:uncharacterized protein
MDRRLLEAMLEARFYPRPCHNVEVVQTLTAWLLFADDFVYKIKKPVYFSFIDGRTPARCYRLCHNEVIINQRLAPTVYRGVVGIAERSKGYMLVTNATLSEPGMREFAVVMHRLPSERMLSQRVASRTISPAEIKKLADTLAAFHFGGSIAQSKIWGSALALVRLMATTAAEAKALSADTVSCNRLVTAARYLRSYVISHRQLLDRRARSGRVREVHGDLRADYVCLAPQATAIIGGIEYSESLRYCDVASELASLMLDLEMTERNDLADALVQAYIAASDDAELAGLIPFYKCYRAVRRGQLETLTSLQPELPREQRLLARHNARRWYELAESVATSAARPASS